MATWRWVVIAATGFAGLFSARYAIGLFLSRQQCDQRTTDYPLWTNSYWTIQAAAVFFVVASIFLLLTRKRNGLAINASRLVFLLISLLCINELATLNLTFTDGVFFTSCSWEDWNDLEESYAFVVLLPLIISTILACIMVGLIHLMLAVARIRRG